MEKLIKKSERMRYIEVKKLESHSEYRVCVRGERDREIEIAMYCAKRSYICQRRARSTRDFETNVRQWQIRFGLQGSPQKL